MLVLPEILAMDGDEREYEWRCVTDILWLSMVRSG